MGHGFSSWRLRRCCSARGLGRCALVRAVVPHFAGTMMDFSEAADSCEILWSHTQHVLELRARFIVASELEQRTAECDTG